MHARPMHIAIGDRSVYARWWERTRGALPAGGGGDGGARGRAARCPLHARTGRVGAEREHHARMVERSDLCIGSIAVFALARAL